MSERGFNFRFAIYDLDPGNFEKGFRGLHRLFAVIP